MKKLKNQFPINQCTLSVSSKESIMDDDRFSQVLVLKHHVAIIYLSIHIAVYCLNICYFFVSEPLSRIQIKALASLYQISMKGDFESFKSD